MSTMMLFGNDKQELRASVTPGMRHAAAQILGAALAPTGVTVEELAGTKGGLQLTWPKGSAQEMTLVVEPGTGPAKRGKDVIHVLRRAPSRMREELRLKGLNFVDIGTGAVRFTSQGLMIDRTDLGRTDRLTRQAEHRSPFSDRASLVARVLLSGPKRTWRLSELAVQSEVSRALASRVVSGLAEENLVSAIKEGRKLRVNLQDPWPLFLRWVGEYRWSDNPALTVAAPVGSMQRFLPRIQEHFSSLPKPPRWALTLQAAAAQLAPKASWDTVHLYVDCRSRSELTQLAGDLQWPPSGQGKVMLLAPRYRRATWWKLEERHRLPVVHEVQLLLDLWHYPVRGREQAEYLARKLGWPPLPA